MLGNLTLIEKPINRSIGNKNYTEKVRIAFAVPRRVFTREALCGLNWEEYCYLLPGADAIVHSMTGTEQDALHFLNC